MKDNTTLIILIFVLVLGGSLIAYFILKSKTDAATADLKNYNDSLANKNTGGGLSGLLSLIPFII
jgi:hypothetical protein